jgi:hypothetical protein
VGIISSFVFFARVIAVVRDLEDEPAWLWLLALFGMVGTLASVIALTVLGAILPHSAVTAGPQLARCSPTSSGSRWPSTSSQWRSSSAQSGG